MNKNIGKNDKIIRIIVAIIAAYFGYTVSPWFYIITGVAIITSITSWCALYDILGISTSRAKKTNKSSKKRR